MKKVRNLLLALMVAAFSLPAMAQNFALHVEFDSSAALLPDTVTLGFAYTFKIKIRNDSLTTFTDALTLSYVADTTHSSTPGFSSGIEYPTPITDTIAPGQSISLTLIAHVTGPVFKAGPSVVVIWPIVQSGSTTITYDSIIKPLVVLDLGPVGIPEQKENPIRMSVNDGQVQLFAGPETVFKYVRIYDLAGRLVLEENSSPNNIPLSPMQKGAYLLEVGYDNRRRVFKFIYD